MNFWDSRARVVEIINHLKAFAPAAFDENTSTPIIDAGIVIEGEP